MAHTHDAHGHDARMPMAPHTGGHHGDDHGTDVHHEASDVNIRAIFTFVVGLFVTMVATYGVVLGLFKYLDRTTSREVSGRVYPLAADQADRLPPEPRLQTNPRGDLGDLRTSEQELLQNYSWVDRNAGIVRIPLDEAIRLTLQRGLPARETPR